MDMAYWYCSCKDDGDEYNKPGKCPKCGEELQMETIEDQSHLFATPTDCDESVYGDNEPPRY